MNYGYQKGRGAQINPKNIFSSYEFVKDHIEGIDEDSTINPYAFSPRANTKAAQIEDLLTDKERNIRLRHLQQVQNEIQIKIRKKLEGERKIMLVEGFNIKDGIKKWYGRTSCNRLVHFASNKEGINYKWSWVEVEITEAKTFSCQGKLLNNLGTNPNF